MQAAAISLRGIQSVKIYWEVQHKNEKLDVTAQIYQRCDASGSVLVLVTCVVALTISSLLVAH